MPSYRATDVQHLSGQVKGYQVVKRHFHAKKGQSLNISMASSNRSAYFNLTAPNKDSAFFNGSMSDNQFEGIASATGKYTIDIYLMRNAARRNEKADFRLEIIKGDRIN
ncbi:hypothetical protein A4G19_00480 [Pasteurellaceae bacterium Macca]|nr:hypothetical protein [Pasteurellaceae bacterium Macca]